MHPGKPVAKPPAPRSEASSKLFILFGALGLGLIFALAYILGQTSQDKTQRGLEEKLVLVRQKISACQQDREMLRKRHTKVAASTKTTAQKMQKENDDLAEENNQLMEDNESLREEKNVLEETINDLRDELDKKGQVSPEEVKQVIDYRKAGNVSAQLSSFLAEQEKWGSVDKDSLINKLIAELKHKKTQLAECRGVPVPKPSAPRAPKPSLDD
eukprot:RCo033580